MSTNEKLKGKTCLITGATSGIGEVAAIELAKMGADVVLVGRNEERCANSLKKVAAAQTIGKSSYLVADMSSRREVLALAEQFKKEHDTLDILLNNAGAIFFDNTKSEDGIEMTWALNHFGYFWLTNALLDTISNSKSARIINVASAAHKRGFFTDGLIDERNDFGYKTYANSKLANVLFTFELAKRLEGKNITVNALHPGVVTTNFALNNGIGGRLFNLASSFFAVSLEAGADTMIYLASADDVKGVTGKYFVKRKEKQSSGKSRDARLAQQLWEVSENRTRQIDEKVARAGV